MDNFSHNYSGFYYLCKEFDISSAATWWRNKLKRLIEDTRINSRSKNLLEIESKDYNSEKFEFINLHSQQYCCQMVKMAMDRHSTIIIMQSLKVCFDHMPSIKSYKNLVIMNNPQQTYFSPDHMPRNNAGVDIISRSV